MQQEICVKEVSRFHLLKNHVQCTSYVHKFIKEKVWISNHLQSHINEAHNASNLSPHVQIISIQQIICTFHKQIYERLAVDSSSD